MLFSAAVMAVELNEEVAAEVRCALMKLQNSGLNQGRITLHEDGLVTYSLHQFLCSGGTTDIHAVGTMLTTAVLEIAAIFLLSDVSVKAIPIANVLRTGLA
jgi:hypothetical protein